MYNLLVTGGEGAWDEPGYIFDLGRFLEYTDDAVKARFSSLDSTAVATLKQLPCLFAYEDSVGQAARVGGVKTVQRRGAAVRITYEFDTEVPPIDPKRLSELAWELEIGPMK